MSRIYSGVPLHGGDFVRTELCVVLLAVLIGAGLSGLAIDLVESRRPLDEAALGKATFSIEARFEGSTVGAYRVPRYREVLAASQSMSPGGYGLWLGNSQMHAVNEGVSAQNTAAGYASDELGFPVVALTLPNACIEEHLFVAVWATRQYRPRFLVVPVVYDDLREVGLRPELIELGLHTDEKLMRKLGLVEAAKDLRGLEIEVDGMAEKGGSLLSISIQPLCESLLDKWLDQHVDLWRLRTSIRGFVRLSLMSLRNDLFGINSQTKRSMIPARYDRNMLALDTLVEYCKDEDIPLLIYIAPLRWVPEPPYRIDEYSEWRDRLTRNATKRGVKVLNYEELIPNNLWGLYTDGQVGDVDFMHFQEEGHRILGAQIADDLKIIFENK